MTTDTPERRPELAGASGGAHAAGSPEPAGTHEQRRSALREAVAEAAASAAHGQPEVAVHPFAHDAAAVAIGGAFDHVGIERLRGTLRDIGRVAVRELVMDFSALSGCEPALARVLAAARMRYLVAGTEVQWHHVPPELAQHFHNNQREAFAILDGDPAVLDPERVRVPTTDASTIAARLTVKKQS